MSHSSPPTQDLLSQCPTLPLNQFVLFGDSITQGSFDQLYGFAAAAQLSSDYIRRLDVVNRGYNGYNTDMALKILPSVFPLGQCGKIDYITVLFGANDACNPGGSSRQGVPLDRFKSNLKAILTHPNILAHKPRIILITTPAVDEYQLKDDHRPDGKVDKGRSAERAKAYADACREVGNELIAAGADLAICDLWSAMIKNAGGTKEGGTLPGSFEVEKNKNFRQMLYDGLHFTGIGYRVLYEQLTETLADRWPDSHPERLQRHFPDWTAWLQGLPVDGSEEKE